MFNLDNVSLAVFRRFPDRKLTSQNNLRIIDLMFWWVLVDHLQNAFFFVIYLNATCR